MVSHPLIAVLEQDVQVPCTMSTAHVSSHPLVATPSVLKKFALQVTAVQPLTVLFEQEVHVADAIGAH